MSPHNFTILQVNNPSVHVSSSVFTKKFRRDRNGKIIKNRVSLPHYFDVKELHCSDIQALHGLLADLEYNPHAMHIRGQLKGGLGSKRVRRKKANFQDIDRQYICLDFDNITFPDYIDPLTEIGGIGDYLASLLPKEFGDVSYVLQFSSSFGMEALLGQGEAYKTIKVHLWFFLDRPVSSMDLRLWGKHVNERQTGFVDTSLFNPIQPHFTAAPVFDGLSDPIVKRTHFIERESGHVVIDIPDDESSALRQSLPQTFSSGRGFEFYLRAIGKLNGFHRATYQAACSYVSRCRLKGLEPNFSYCKDRLRDAIFSADPEHRLVGDIERYGSEQYLDGQLRSAVNFVFSSQQSIIPESDHPPTYPDNSVSLGTGRDLLDGVVRDFFHNNVFDYWEAHDSYQNSLKRCGSENNKTNAMNFTPFMAPRLLVTALAPDVGVGKTYAVMKEALNWVREEKARNGFCRPVGIIVPDHKLARQVQQDIQAQILSQTDDNIKVAVYRGMTADDPENPGNKMCRCLSRVRPLQEVALSARKYACGVGMLNLEDQCPLMDTCAYWGGNMSDLEDADIIIMTHANYFLSPPIKEMRVGGKRQFAMIVIDENIIGSFIPERKIFFVE